MAEEEEHLRQDRREQGQRTRGGAVRVGSEVPESHTGWDNPDVATENMDRGGTCSTPRGIRVTSQRQHGRKSGDY